MASAAILGSVRWNALSAADKIIAVLLWLTILQEIIASVLAHFRGNNMASYHFYSVAELLAISAYFAVGSTRTLRVVSIILGVTGFMFSIVNSIWIQPLTRPNTYFLMCEASMIIVLSLIGLYQITLNEEFVPLRMMRFWIALLLMLYWSVTFAAYGMMGSLKPGTALTIVAASILQGANLLFYVSVALLLVRYPKLEPTGESR